MKKKLNFKKSWTYLLILGFVFSFAIIYFIGVGLLTENDLNTVIGHVYGVDLTVRFFVICIGMYSSLTLLFLLIYLLIQWCFKHIVIE